MTDLPLSIQNALEAGDEEALKIALNELTPDEAETIVESLIAAGVISLEPPDGGDSANPFQEFEPLLGAVAAVAKGAVELRPQIEEVLPSLEENGWKITGPIHRIWDGERDPETLVEGMDPEETELILQVLDLIDRPSMEEVLAEMPEPIQAAFQLAGEEFSAAFGKAIQELPIDEAEDIIERLEDAGLIQ